MPIVRNLPDPAGTAAVVAAPAQPAAEVGVQPYPGREITLLFRLVGLWLAVGLWWGWIRRMLTWWVGGLVG